ncbi:hypothetical protein H9X96_12960 [Pedobacter sp. N36a]|uniref:hypothetical protein n=1 Tax=Pedobacter sp. N36a TaxID=2767996 RepID=UPI001656B578|nr:hypothetical protein [Pedobacter sp. N36a]MBC8986687.1 hypothetical protein [Pedobacter sp. N36a]
MDLTALVEIKTIHLTFVGNFNPAIVQPYWLAQKGLIRESEAQDVKIELIHNEFTRFSLDWVTIEVRQDRFDLHCSQEPYFDIVKDLCVGIFNSLKETPIKALGINHIWHCDLKSAEKYYEFGNKLTPLSNFNFLNDARMILLEIIEAKRSDNKPGSYRIRIEPTDKTSSIYGVAININDHFGLEVNQSGQDREILAILKENFSYSGNRMKEVVTKLLVNLDI